MFGVRGYRLTMHNMFLGQPRQEHKEVETENTMSVTIAWLAVCGLALLNVAVYGEVALSTCINSFAFWAIFLQTALVAVVSRLAICGTSRRVDAPSNLPTDEEPQYLGQFSAEQERAILNMLAQTFKKPEPTVSNE